MRTLPPRDRHRHRWRSCPPRAPLLGKGDAEPSQGAHAAQAPSRPLLPLQLEHSRMELHFRATKIAVGRNQENDGSAGVPRWDKPVRGAGGGGWHKASVFGCLPLGAPIGLSPLLILTLCGPERVLVVSTGGGVWYGMECPTALSEACRPHPRSPCIGPGSGGRPPRHWLPCLPESGGGGG